jgi:hypothetical protein
MSEPGRDELGQFAEGNEFSNGRNKYLRQQELKQLFADAITDSEIQRLANKLMAMALDGDTTAAKLLLTTLFKDPQTPAIALQINNGSMEARKAQSIAIANRIKMDHLRKQAGIHEHRVADKAIDVQAKRGTGGES